MLWRFHSLALRCESDDARIREHWQRAFASLTASDAPHDLSIELSLSPEVPARPRGEPQFRQGDLLEYFVVGEQVVAHFPRYGQLRLDLAAGSTRGLLVTAALDTYGVFEDWVAISLSPHLRRRGLFLIHAFGATPPPNPLPASREGGGVLLVGGIGSGKTTTGMALLDAGWKLLSNDSPVVTASAEILSYPGLLAAYPDTFARFDATATLAQNATGPRRKLALAAESIWPDVWIDRAPAAAIVFPHIEARADHAVEPIAPSEALRRLLPHAVEQWDRVMIGEHLRVLKNLVERAPAYLLRLGPDVRAIPALLSSLLTDH
jgi:hypothetical protein